MQMLNANVAAKVRAHLKLAEGFIKTAGVEENSREYEVRNAFSRAYYAFFHLRHALLFGKGVDVEKQVGKDKERLHKKMEIELGKPFGKFLRQWYESRRQADYVPEWSAPTGTVALERLKSARTQFYWVFHTTRRGLG